MRYFKTVLILFALSLLIVTAVDATVPKDYDTDMLDHLYWLDRAGGWGITWIDTFCGELAAWLFDAPTGWADSIDWDTFLIRPIGW